MKDIKAKIDLDFSSLNKAFTTFKDFKQGFDDAFKKKVKPEVDDSEIKKAGKSIKDFNKSFVDAFKKGVKPKVDDSDVKKKLKALPKLFSEAGQKAGEGFAKKVKESLKSISVVAFGNLLANAVTGAIGAVKGLADESFRLYEIQREAEQKIQGMIEITGKNAGFTLDQLKQMASSLQNVTNFGDEAILAAQTTLMTFQSIRGDNFERATTSMLDLATAMGTDLPAAAQMLGKALEFPELAIRQLRSAGVNFTAAEEEMLQGFVAIGNTAQAQEFILNKLEGSIGGLAEKMAHPLIQFQNRIGDIKEEFGGLVAEVGLALLPVFDQLATTIEAIVPILKSLLDSMMPVFEKIIGMVQVLIESIASSIMPLITQFVNALMPLYDVLSTLLDAAMQLLEPIFKLLSPIMNVIKSISTIVAELVNSILGSVLTDLVGMISNLVDLLMPIFDILNSLMPVVNVLLKTVLVPIMAAIKIVIAGVNLLLKPITLLLDWISKFIDMWVSMVMPIYEALFEVFDALFGVFEPFFDIFNSIVDAIFGALAPTKDFGSSLSLVGDIAKSVAKFIKGLADQIRGLVDGIKTFFGVAGKKKPAVSKDWHGLEENIKGVSTAFDSNTKSATNNTKALAASKKATDGQMKASKDLMQQLVELAVANQQNTDKYINLYEQAKKKVILDEKEKDIRDEITAKMQKEISLANMNFKTQQDIVNLLKQQKNLSPKQVTDLQNSYNHLSNIAKIQKDINDITELRLKIQAVEIDNQDEILKILTEQKKQLSIDEIKALQNEYARLQLLAEDREKAEAIVKAELEKQVEFFRQAQRQAGILETGIFNVGKAVSDIPKIQFLDAESVGGLNVLDDAISNFENSLYGAYAIMGAMEVQASQLADALLDVVGSFGDTFGQMLADGEDFMDAFSKSTIKTMIDLADKMVNLYIPQIMGAFSSLGPWGVPAGLAAIATLKTMLAVAKSVAGAEEGYMDGVQRAGRPGASDTMPIWINPQEVVLTERMRRQNEGMLRSWFAGTSPEQYYYNKFKREDRADENFLQKKDIKLNATFEHKFKDINFSGSKFNISLDKIKRKELLRL